MPGDKIKGTCVKTVLGFLSKEDLLAPVMESLSPATREVFSGVMLATTWYPADAYIELLDHVARRVGIGRDWMMLGLGKRIVAEGLTTVYKGFLPVASPGQAVSRSHFLWRTYFRNSELKVVRAEEGGADFEVLCEARTSPAYCLTKLGGMIGALELVGARGVAGEHTLCRSRGDETCRFRLTWTA